MRCPGDGRTTQPTREHVTKNIALYNFLNISVQVATRCDCALQRHMHKNWMTESISICKFKVHIMSPAQVSTQLVWIYTEYFMQSGTPLRRFTRRECDRVCVVWCAHARALVLLCRSHMYANKFCVIGKYLKYLREVRSRM